MRRILMLAMGVLFVASSMAIAADHAYVGVNRCKMCHKGEMHGNIYEKWASTPHAKAYELLGTDQAKEVYTKLGKTGNPQEDPNCLKCHVTGYGKDASLTAKVDKANGVTCEACHGPGGDYWKKSVMENHDAAVAAGLIADPKPVCVSCHNDKSPTFKSFNFDEMWPKIKHGLPQAEK